MARSHPDWIHSQDAAVRHDWKEMDRFYRDQLEAGNRPSLRIPYRPTNWAKDDSPAEQRHLMGGFDLANGTCPECFQILSKTGTCFCSE